MSYANETIIKNRARFPMLHRLVLICASADGFELQGMEHEPIGATCDRLARMRNDNPRVAQWFAVAEAMLQELDFPTDAMITAGERALANETARCAPNAIKTAATFRSMIRAALEGK